MGAKGALRRDVGSFERDSKPGARVLRAAWIRALQDPEGVPEEVVRTEKAASPLRHSPQTIELGTPTGGSPPGAWNNGEEGFWPNISQHDRMVKMAPKIKDQEYRALAELRYRIRR